MADCAKLMEELKRIESTPEYAEIKANIDAIEDALKCVQQLEAELQEIYDLQKRIMNEECAPDEKHCTCVPLLRHKCKQLEAENTRLKEELAIKNDVIKKLQDKRTF